jgi:hypothetical protein
MTLEASMFNIPVDCDLVLRPDIVAPQGSFDSWHAELIVDGTPHTFANGHSPLLALTNLAQMLADRLINGNAQP